jgi:hypothetical protein
LSKHLPVVLFKDREDYIAYGKQTEHGELAWTAGFYSQRSNRAIFFDESSGNSAASFARETDGLKAQIEALNTQIDAARRQGQLGMVNSLTLKRNRAFESLAQANARLGNQVVAQNNSKTLHEAAHQVSFNLGIQSRTVDYPLWFSEGLACSFEFEDGQGHHGPALLNPGRIVVIKEALRDLLLVKFPQEGPALMKEFEGEPNPDRLKALLQAAGLAGSLEDFRARVPSPSSSTGS